MQQVLTEACACPRPSSFARGIRFDPGGTSWLLISAFFGWLGLDPLPAGTVIQARLCRGDPLAEIEAIAVAAAG